MKTFTKMLLIMLAVILTAGSVHATPTLTLTNGATTITITDGGVGDASGVDGVVAFLGSIGDFIVNISSGATKPILGSSTFPWMDLGVSTNVSSVASVLEISFTDDLFTYSGGMSMGVGGTFQNTTTFETRVNDVAISSLTLGPGPDSGTAWGTATLASSDKLTLYAKIDHNAGGSSTFNMEVVPEPGTLMLLGSGLVGTAFFARRKRS